ncbi:MAG TPA: hypothetical protein VF530_13925 [Planctomycetota bacterium]
MTIQNDLLRSLGGLGVRFVTIGVWGVNLYARDVSFAFVTQDLDLFLPRDPENLLLAWKACEEVGLELRAGTEPLDEPHDLFVAQAVVQRTALTRATDGRGFLVDLTLVMAGFEFDEVWAERRVFQVHGLDVPVARLTHIARSKAEAGRPKDRLFLATHKEMLADLIRRHEGP